MGLSYKYKYEHLTHMSHYLFGGANKSMIFYHITRINPNSPSKYDGHYKKINQNHKCISFHNFNSILAPYNYMLKVEN